MAVLYFHLFLLSYFFFYFCFIKASFPRFIHWLNMYLYNLVVLLLLLFIAVFVSQLD